MKNILLALIICLVSCTEKMEIDVNDAPSQLVIYGTITTDTTQHAISVRRSSNYFSNTAPEGISNATVTLSDGEKTFILTENPSEKGVYLTTPDVFGTEGKTYTLKVAVEFNGTTEEYEATSFLPYSARVDSVVFRQSGLAADIIAVMLYGMLPASANNYLNIVAYKNDTVPVNDKLSEFNIIASENTDNRKINGAVCMYIRSEYDEDREYMEKGDLVTFQIRSITKEYADYVQDVQSESRGSVPIFGGPPANVRTNILPLNESNTAPVCGFFTAYSKTESSTVYR